MPKHNGHARSSALPPPQSKKIKLDDELPRTLEEYRQKIFSIKSMHNFPVALHAEIVSVIDKIPNHNKYSEETLALRSLEKILYTLVHANHYLVNGDFLSSEQRKHIRYYAKELLLKFSREKDTANAVNDAEALQQSIQDYKKITALDTIESFFLTKHFNLSENAFAELEYSLKILEEFFPEGHAILSDISKKITILKTRSLAYELLLSDIHMDEDMSLLKEAYDQLQAQIPTPNQIPIRIRVRPALFETEEDYQIHERIRPQWTDENYKELLKLTYKIQDIIKKKIMNKIHSSMRNIEKFSEPVDTYEALCKLTVNEVEEALDDISTFRNGAKENIKTLIRSSLHKAATVLKVYGDKLEANQRAIENPENVNIALSAIESVNSLIIRYLDAPEVSMEVEECAEAGKYMEVGEHKDSELKYPSTPPEVQYAGGPACFFRTINSGSGPNSLHSEPNPEPDESAARPKRAASAPATFQAG